MASSPPKHCPLWLFYTPVVCLSQLRNHQCYTDINWISYFSGFHYSFSNILFLIPGSLQNPALQLWLLGLLSAVEFSRCSLPLKILATVTAQLFWRTPVIHFLKHLVTFMYLCVCVHMCTNACAHMWRSEGHWQELFFLWTMCTLGIALKSSGSAASAFPDKPLHQPWNVC